MKGFIEIKRGPTKKAGWSGPGLTAEIKQRLGDIYVPPAYKNVLVAKSATRKVQVIGEDKAGRKQYIYHEKYKSGLEKRKYDKLEQLVPKVRIIEKDNRAALRALDKKPPANWTREDLIDLVVYMLINYHFRIGCSKYVDLYKSYGITTLKPEHFHREGRGYHIKFRGKKGILNETRETSPLVNRLITTLLERAKKHGYEYVFNYASSTTAQQTSIIESQDVQDFLMSSYKIDVTPKMFRTYYANYHMIEYIRDFIDSPEYTACKGNMKKIGQLLKRNIAEHVSAKLNNTPAICKKNYLNNALFEDIVNKPKKYLEKINANKHKIHRLVLELLKD